MELDKIITLIHSVSDSALTGFTLEEGNMKLVLEKVPKPPVALPHEYQTVIREAVPPAYVPSAIEQTAYASAQSTGITSTESGTVTAGGQLGEQPSAPASVTLAAPGQSVKSPLVGTFYTAPSPEEAEFVKVGDTVKKGQILGIIEAMKLMNEIESEYDGVVEAILVQNEQMVEYGQEMFVIR